MLLTRPVWQQAAQGERNHEAITICQAAGVRVVEILQVSQYHVSPERSSLSILADV